MRNLLLILALFLVAQISWAKNIQYKEMYLRFDSLQKDGNHLRDIFDNDVSEYSQDLEVKGKGKKLTLNIISEKKLNKLFTVFKNKKNIPFSYAVDGCYARAHRMSYLAQRRGVISGKVFINGSLDPFPEKPWRWKYHVAPVFAVKVKNQVELKVVDPSLFTGPVGIAEWAEKSIGSMVDSPFNIVLTSRFSYNYSDIYNGPKNWFHILDLINTWTTLREYSSR